MRRSPGRWVRTCRHVSSWTPAAYEVPSGSDEWVELYDAVKSKTYCWIRHSHRSVWTAVSTTTCADDVAKQRLVRTTSRNGRDHAREVGRVWRVEWPQMRPSRRLSEMLEGVLLLAIARRIPCFWELRVTSRHRRVTGAPLCTAGLPHDRFMFACRRPGVQRTLEGPCRSKRCILHCSGWTRGFFLLTAGSNHGLDSGDAHLARKVLLGKACTRSVMTSSPTKPFRRSWKCCHHTLFSSIPSQVVAGCGRTTSCSKTIARG